MISKPSISDVPAYFGSYYQLVDGKDLIGELHSSRDLTVKLFQSISTEKGKHAYAEGKWTIEEVFRHIIDCERIYAYRALRFSRFDDVELPGFDENAYISKMYYHQSDIQNLIREYSSLRDSNIQLFESMNDKMLDFKGCANGIKMNARALGFMIVGHNLHHCNIIKERYL